MATIKDVAKEAGVSIATVSRVLNGNYPVSNESRDAVNEAIQKLSYQPNDVARSLKQNKTFLIGIVVPDISNVFFMELAKGVESVVEQHGYNLVFGSTEEEAKKEINLLQAFGQKRLDGVIVASRQSSTNILNGLPKSGVGMVMVDTYISGVEADCVIENDYEASYDIVTHLIEQGHKRIAIVNGLLSTSTSTQRLKGYKDALRDHQIDVKESYLLPGNYSRSQSYNATKKLLASDCIPTAFYSTNNVMTEGVMMALKDAKLTIPGDMSLVSFGNISLPGLIEPELTYIKQNAYKMGVKAGERLLLTIDDNCKNGGQLFTLPLNIHYGKSVSTPSDLSKGKQPK